MPCVEQLLREHKTRTKRRVLQTPLKNTYFRYKCEKVILSSYKRLRPSKARESVCQTLFFDMTREKFNLGHAFLLERVRNRDLYT